MEELEKEIWTNNSEKIINNWTELNNKELNETRRNLIDFKMMLAVGETVLAIPLLWWFIILASAWTILMIMLILHIIALVLIIQNNNNFENNEDKYISKNWNIVWIAASILGFIPFLGMLLHIISAIVLWSEYSKNK